jgi:hypothetical protein
VDKKVIGLFNIFLKVVHIHINMQVFVARDVKFLNQIM